VQAPLKGKYMPAITEYLQILVKGDSLTMNQATELLDVVFGGDVPEVQVAAFLTAMRIKRPTAAELAGLAKSLRNHAASLPLELPKNCRLIDTCGTGGARFKTCNVSTAAALVAAGAGAYVAKHGNRGITSSCGSADVLAALGVRIDAPADVVARCIENARIGFIFAPRFHPAMKYVQPIRKSLGFPTVFNLLGPLANPARPAAQLLGVADESLMPVVAEALRLLNTSFAMIVHSNGLDEITNLGPTKIIELRDGRLTEKHLDPCDLGTRPASEEQLKVDNPTDAAQTFRRVLTGRETGPRKDIIVLNAAAALIVAGVAEDFPAAVKLADNAIADGSAEHCLDKLIEISNKPEHLRPEL
jgi:anthranilate phosphoribosyltransferase